MSNVSDVPADESSGTYMWPAWRTLIVVSIGSFMTVLDATVINVAIHSLQQHFGVSTVQAQWTISGYALALGIATPLAGQLGDRFGAKRVYILSIGAFAGASLLCGLAPSLPLLVAARVCQGLAGGFALPLGAARLFKAFPAERRGFAFGVFGLVLVVAPMIGPVVGGVLLEFDLLAWIFYINVPIAAVGVWLGTRFLEDDETVVRGASSAEPDVIGVVLAVISFGGVLFGTVTMEAGSIDAITLAAFVAGLAALVILVIHELRCPKPLLNFRLFRTTSFSLGVGINAVGQIAFYGIQFLLPLWLQVVHEHTELGAGLALLPLAVAAGVSGLIAGRVRDRIGARVPLTAAFLLVAVGAGLFAVWTTEPGLGVVTLMLVITGLGAGAIPPITQVAALSDVSRDGINSGTSVLQAFQRLFQALGVAVLATVISASVTIPARVPGHQQQFAAGLTVGFVVVLCTALACAVSAAFLPGWPRPATDSQGT